MKLRACIATIFALVLFIIPNIVFADNQTDDLEKAFNEHFNNWKVGHSIHHHDWTKSLIKMKRDLELIKLLQKYNKTPNFP